MAIATRLCKMVTYLDGVLPIMALGLVRSSDTLNVLYLHYPSAFVLYFIICEQNINHDYLIMSLRRIKKFSHFEYTCISQT